jgi:hypothetical protein
MNAALVAVVQGDAHREGGALVLLLLARHRECFLVIRERKIR